MADNIFKLLGAIDNVVSNLRTKMYSGADWATIDDLPLSYEQKKCVLEWFANKIFELQAFMGDVSGCKSYDPLTIDGNTAHSYVFDFKDGGRHHQFRTLRQLEEWLMDELKQLVADILKEDNTQNKEV